MDEMKSKIIFRRNCPSCGHQTGTSISELRYAIYDHYPIRRDVNFVCCDNCSLHFYDTTSTEENYNTYYKIYEYYNTANSSGMGGVTEKDVQRFSNYVDVIESNHIDKKGLIADIGCSQGGLLQVLKEKGYSNLHGVDLLKSNVDVINRAVCRATVGDASSIPLSDNSAQMIFLTHVLEHVYNLSAAFREIERVLAYDGLAYIEVPNLASYPTIKEAPLYDFFHEHINHFDMRSLVQLITFNGFSVLEIGEKAFDGKSSTSECLYSLIRKGTGPQKTYEKVVSVEKLFSGTPNVDAFLKEVDPQVPINIWGLSSYMLLLLENVLLPKFKVVALYDADEHKQRQTINGLEIRPPETLLKANDGGVVVIPRGPFYERIQTILVEHNYAGKIYVI